MTTFLLGLAIGAVPGLAAALTWWLTLPTDVVMDDEPMDLRESGLI